MGSVCFLSCSPHKKASLPTRSHWCSPHVTIRLFALIAPLPAHATSTHVPTARCLALRSPTRSPPSEMHRDDLRSSSSRRGRNRLRVLGSTERSCGALSLPESYEVCAAVSCRAARRSHRSSTGTTCASLRTARPARARRTPCAPVGRANTNKTAYTKQQAQNSTSPLAGMSASADSTH